MRRLENLPPSDDKEFWDGETSRHKKVRINICKLHNKNHWMEGSNYITNEDGSITCALCGWGTFIPGYYKVYDGKIVDLRDAINLPRD